MKNELQNELLSAYLDGELTAAEQAQVERLLAADPRARQLFEELRALSSAIKSLPPEKLGADLSESVLRIAERRILTEPAAVETPAVPLSKAILRRLKNPRIWAWQVVIVAVAVLLMLYNPNQPAPPRGPERREVALTPKDEEWHRGLEKAPAIEPAPTELAAERFKVADMPKGAAEMKAAERPLGEEGFAARKSVGVSTQPTPPMSEKPALAKADYAKKETVIRNGSELKEGDLVSHETLNKEILADKDVAKLGFGFKAQAKGAYPTAESETQTALPAQEPVSTGQTIAGGIQSDKAAIVKFNAKAVQLAQKQPSPAPVSPPDQVLIVHCDITRRAMENQAFDKLLANNDIVWSDAPVDDQFEKNLPVQERVQAGSDAISKLDAKVEQPARKALSRSRSAGARFNLAPAQGGAMKVEAPQVVYVEATPAQIQATIAGLTSQSEAFSSVSLSTANDVKELEGLDLREEQAKQGAEVIRGVRAKALQTDGNAGNLARTTPEAEKSAETGAALGRAYHFGYYSEDRFRELIPETTNRSRRLADNRQPASSPATPTQPAPTDRAGKSGAGLGGQAIDFGTTVQSTPPQMQKQELSDQAALSAQSRSFWDESAKPSTSSARGEAGNQQETYRPTEKPEGQVTLFGTERSQSVAPPRLQRALFVLRVVDTKESAAKSKSSAEAEVAPPDADKAKQ